MKLIVNPHKIDLIKEEAVNEKEINISKCTFEFSEEFSDSLVKEAYFTLDGETYKQIIVNNECSYPPEVLDKVGTVELGVVAYEIAGSEYIERFNPSPVYFQTVIGSLKDHAENSQEITPSEMEQFEQALEEGLAEVQNVDIDASKTGNTATVSITNRNGETKTVEIYDGEKGEDGESGITPNIQVGTTTTLPAGSNATVTQRGTTENPIFDFGIPKGEDGEGQVTSVNGQTGDVVINIPDTSGLGASIELSINSSTYIMTLNLKNKIGTVLSTGTVDLPLESVVVNGTYDNTNKKIILTLQNGNTIDVPVGDLVSGLQETLVSGTNIKTINNESILGSGNLTISGGQKLPTIITYNDTSATTVSAMNEWLSNCDFANKQLAEIYAFNSNGNMRWQLVGVNKLDITSSTTGSLQLYLLQQNIGANTQNSNISTAVLSLTLTNGQVTGVSWSNKSEGKTLLTSSINQDISAKFTFSSNLPESSLVPSNDNQLTNKKYVDDAIASGGTVPNYFIYGNYLIYNLSPGNYKVVPSSQTWSSNTNLPTSEIAEALKLAYENNKILILSMYTTNTMDHVDYIGISVPTTSGTSYSGTAVIVSSNGNTNETALAITYSYSNDEFSVSSTSVRATNLKALGTSNSTSYTPVNSYNPATKGYVDNIAIPTSVTSATSTYTIASLTGNYSYKLGEITSLTITSSTASDQETLIYFESGSTATGVSLPDTISNLGDAPTMTTASNVNTGTCEANKNYIISVLNNIAVWKAY